MYKFDDCFGIADGSIRRIGVADVETGEQKLLPPTPLDCFLPAWSPDGAALAFYSRPFPHAKAARAALNVVQADGSGFKQLTGEDARINPCSPPAFTGDGKILYMAWGEDGLSLPFTIPIGGGERAPFFPKAQICHGVGACCVSRTVYGLKNDQFALDADGGLWFLSAEQGNDGVYHLAASEDAARRVTTSSGSVHEFCAPRGGIPPVHPRRTPP